MRVRYNNNNNNNKIVRVLREKVLSFKINYRTDTENFKWKKNKLVHLRRKIILREPNCTVIMCARINIIIL